MKSLVLALRIVVVVGCLGAGQASMLSPLPAPPVAQTEITWYYSASLYERPSGPVSHPWHYTGGHPGSISAKAEAQARDLAEKEIRDSWNKSHSLGGTELKIEFDWFSSEPRTDQQEPAPGTPATAKSPLVELPFVTTLKKSGKQVEVGREIGSDRSCVVAYLPFPSLITEVRVRAHDKLGEKQDAAMWLYIDGKPVAKADKQNVRRDGEGTLKWTFETPQPGSMISLVVREQNWTPSAGGKTETAHVYWISADFKKVKKAKVSSVLLRESPGINLPSPDGAKTVHTVKCDVNEASTILVFADDFLGKTQRAHLQVSVNGTILGRKPVYLAGSWIRFDVNGAKGNLIEVQSFRENGKANEDDSRIHHIAVLR